MTPIFSITDYAIEEPKKCSACPLNDNSCNTIAEILHVIDHYLPNAKTLYPEFFV